MYVILMFERMMHLQTFVIFSACYPHKSTDTDTAIAINHNGPLGLGLCSISKTRAIHIHSLNHNINDEICQQIGDEGHVKYCCRL